MQLNNNNIRNKQMTTIEYTLKDISQEYPVLKNKVRITTPEIFYEEFRSIFKGKVKEQFVVFWLGTSNIVTGFEIVSVGNLNSSVVHPREVFRSAIINNCNSIILAHNHPSGNIEASQEDIKITKVLIKAGEILNIKVLDHIIFCDENYSSMVNSRII